MYTIYGKSSCPFCTKAEELLNEKGYEYKYIDITQCNETLSYIKSLGCRTVPQVFKDQDHVGGYDDLLATFEV